MRTYIPSIVVASALGCTARLSGDGIEDDDGDAGDTSSIDGDDDGSASASGPASTTASTTTPTPTTDAPSDDGPDEPMTTALDDAGDDTTSGGTEVAGRVGAALLADGLCPWSYDYASYDTPAMTLQITSGSFTCDMVMWSALLDAGEYPGWFIELHFPFAEPGVYDVAQVGGYVQLNVIEADTGGGGAAGPLASGLVEITHVDESTVSGRLSGFVQMNMNGVDYPIDGTFEAVRCTAADWLAADPEEPHDPPLPDGCLNP